MKNASARNMWGDYLDTHLKYVFVAEPKVSHLGDNEEDANRAINLVLAEKKRATSHSLLGLQYRKNPLPKIGDFTVLTDWDGVAKCIVRTVAVRLKPFFAITESYARLDGEGNHSLEAWKQKHWDFYTRELAPFGRVPRDSMIVVCEVFEKVYQR